MIQTLRRAARSAIELLLVGSGAARRSRRGVSGGVAILAYHNVVPTADPGAVDRSLHLPLESFRRQLDRLMRTHRIVSLEEAVREPPGSGRRLAAALTFDDGYRGVLRHAVPELVRRELPATVFVCPGLLGTKGFWWDRVAASEGGLTQERRTRALDELAGRQEAVLARVADAAVPEVCWPVTGEELAELAAAPGITLASHTWSHPNLTRLPDDELAAELERPRAWLTERHPDSVLGGHLTFPYGFWDERVAAAARAAGYGHVYRVEGGVWSPATGAELLPRINVPAGISVKGFEMRASGVSP